jgi:hypothetical protein
LVQWPGPISQTFDGSGTHVFVFDAAILAMVSGTNATMHTKGAAQTRHRPRPKRIKSP